MCFKSSNKFKNFISSNPNVVPMIADWTARQQVIADFLQAYGREGIPYYLVIPGGKGKAIELPTIVLPDNIMDALQKAVQG